MRVFDTYYFNIIDKVSFKDTKPYLDKMLAEVGYCYNSIGFAVYNVIDEATRKNVLAKYPSLSKYSFFEDCSGIPTYGLSSFTENWRSGEIHVNKEDWDVISALFSKIPRPYNFTFGQLILDGINWFEDSDDSILPDFNYKVGRIPLQEIPPFTSSRIMQLRIYDDGKKYNRIYVTVEVTNGNEPRSSKEIIARLIPYLGEPVNTARKCIFAREELEGFNKLKELHREKLSELAKEALPTAKCKKHAYPSNSLTVIPHVADKFTLDKAFKGTGFERQKGTPNWLHLYSCIDDCGFLYEAYTQKLTSCNVFRFWIEISGYNFKIRYENEDYYVEQEGESLEILKKIAEFCVSLREEYSRELAKDFGNTPKWYYID